MTALDLITRERREQIEKHGYTAARDDQYTYGQLAMAAQFCLTDDVADWPWADTDIRDNIREKDRVDRLVIAAAFLAAEIDRELRIIGAAV